MISTEEAFAEKLREETQRTEKIVTGFLPKESGYAKRVIEAMNYSMLAGGKRLRPMFIEQTGRMYGGREDLRAPFMAALEMIHTYSLIHDDLPALDNDEFRRGRKTAWSVYGEDMAVIAGDGLLNFAYETALEAFSLAETEEERRAVVAAMKILAANAGIFGMVGGQCADLETDKDPASVDEEKLVYIHMNKTAAMIRSGFQIGAVLAGAPAEDVEALGRCADMIGLAFQIQDDILDVTGSDEELGKATGSDEKDGKVTYVTLHGIDGSRRKVEELTEEALRLFDGLSAENDFLRDLIESLVLRTK